MDYSPRRNDGQSRQPQTRQRGKAPASNASAQNRALPPLVRPGLRPHHRPKRLRRPPARRLLVVLEGGFGVSIWERRRRLPAMTSLMAKIRKWLGMGKKA